MDFHHRGLTDADVERVAAVRRFNRFYTQRIGLLEESWANSRFSLTQARVLYELTRGDRTTAAELARELGLDPGYLSRILRRFKADRLIVTRRSERDRRQSVLSLTARGREQFAPLEARTNEQVSAMLAGLSASAQHRLCQAMRTIHGVLDDSSPPNAPYLLRPARPGDMGWIVSRHGALYSEEYGWDAQLEALCAEIVAAFVRNYDDKRERCWIAEREGENVGCVMLVKETDEVARLRLLLVEPKARGLGIGGRLVDECVGFASAAGYRKIVLWTHSVLIAARRAYERAGFTLVNSWTHNDFGKELVGENWELHLGNDRQRASS
jgi:DNA-binding MarR family transcriptional regulator/GNAT superfamily N-acetyltransferase